MKNYKLLTVLALALAWFYLRSPLWSEAPLLLLPCAVMTWLSVGPMWRWLGGGMVGFPLVESYCLAHFSFYVVPLLSYRDVLKEFPGAVVALSAVATVLFLLSVLITYRVLVRRSSRLKPRFLQPLLRREIQGVRETQTLWVLVAIWWLTEFALLFGYFPDLGAMLNVVRTVAGVAGTAGVFTLFFMSGRRLISPAAQWLLIAAVGSWLLMEFTTVYLINAILLLIAAIMGFSMGRGRLPLGLIVLSFAVLAFLHAGKSQVRGQYWSEEAGYNAAQSNPLEFYAFWFESSLSSLTSSDEADQKSSASIVERASIMQKLTLVINETPDNLPFMLGETYLQTPELFIPRVFYPDKPRGGLPTETLAIYYGVQTSEEVTQTSIAFGQIAESWANFGWLGIVVVGAVFGVIFAVARSLSEGCGLNQVGFLMSAFFIAYCSNLEMTFGQWIVSLSQGVVVAVVILLLLSRPESPSEAAAGQPGGVPRTGDAFSH